MNTDRLEEARDKLEETAGMAAAVLTTSFTGLLGYDLIPSVALGIIAGFLGMLLARESVW